MPLLVSQPVPGPTVERSREAAAEDWEAFARPVRRRLFVGAVFVVATAAMLRRTPSELANRLPGNLGDSALVMWIMQWSSHGLYHDPRYVFNANIFWPYPHTLAYADSLLSVAPVYNALYRVTGKWALAWNLLWIGLILLNLAATYSLTRWLTHRTDAAIFAALAVGFSSYALNNAQHPQLELIGFVPLGFLLLFKLLEAPRWSTAVLFGLVNVVIALGALYIATGYVIALVILLLGFAIAVRGRITKKLLACLAVAGAISLIAAPTIIPYRDVETTFGRRPLSPEWGLRPRDIVRPAAGAYLYKYLARDTDPGSGERHLFPGFSTMALAAVGIGALVADRRRSRNRPLDPTLEPGRRKFTVLLAVTGAVIGILAVGALADGFPTPWKIAYDHIGPLAGVRVPARLGSFCLLAGAVLAAVGLAFILRHIRQPAVRVAITTVACLFVLVELAAPVPYTHIPDDPATLAVYHALSHRPAGAVVELPIFDPGTDPHDWSYGEPSRMVWATIDFHPRVNGYSGYVSPTYYADTALLETIPAPDAMARVKALRVRYLILHVGVQTDIQMYTEDQAHTIIAALPAATATRFGPNYLVDLGTS